ncbi:MAG: hypothetical protein WBO48_19790 [Candidatus Promineifilaceae bacterium]|nr:hypothetical protein [Chloroflexota bacterium]MBK7178945.1 hypothetical protein [Chloroflexota bacterium]MBK7917017.1 hypothetical protein [Chloroflexota bacterium]MBK8933578.1 hypothetical protein [Chloroflexota bacterium]
MAQKPTNQGKAPAAFYRGQGMAMGAGLGLIMGLLLFDQIAVGLVLGVAAGLGIGSTVDLQAGKRRE